MDTPRQSENDRGADLEARIIAAEKAVIERDERSRGRADEIVAHVRTRTVSTVAIGLAAAAGAFVLARLVRRVSRPKVSSSLAGAPAPGPLSWAIRLAALIWPVLPLSLRSRLPPGAAPMLAALGLPLLNDVRRPVGPIPPPVMTAPRVDLGRYVGRWFEIAQIPGGRPACSGEVSATYSLESDGVAIVNRCNRRGRVVLAKGVGHPVEGSNGAKLKVCFAPKWLRWLPLVWGDYWILHVDSGYSHALVGTPDRRYLWILSRTARMSDSDLQRLVDLARSQGYLVNRLKLTPQ